MKANEITSIAAGGSQDECKELLSKLVKKGVLQLNPTLEKAAVRYVEAEETWNADNAKLKTLLKDLTERNLLKPEPLYRVLMCPLCSSPDMHSKYACPRCKSKRVGLTVLLEHMACGNIGLKETYMKGTSLVCPSCQTVLTEGGPDNRVIGNFYQCEKCGHRFDRPEVIHICMNCGTTSTYRTAKYGKVFRYMIQDEVVRELKSELPVLKNLEKNLTNAGFNVRTHAELEGVSGAKSMFDILAEKDGVLLVIDVSTKGDKNDIIEMLAKKADVNPTRAAIVDLSGNSVQDNLGKVYDIIVFKTTVDHTVLQGFDEFLKTLEPK